MIETEELTLTAEQSFAVDEAVKTLLGDGTENLTIGGYAGTGKTFLVKSIIERMTEKGKYVAVVAFTGKAVSVLRKKGVGRAQTLHSLMYKPDRIDGRLTFSKVVDLDCDAVIVDESSMINTALYQDLMSFQVPVVFIGDHGQLEPIGDNPGIMQSPLIRLEKIHRQAEGSAILWLAHLFREGKRPNWSSVPTNEIRRLSLMEARAKCHEYDVVLCGFNKTRVAMNDRVRKNRKLEGDLVVGERLICLKNNRYGFFNGMMMEVLKIHEKKRTFTGSGFVECYEVDVKTDDDRTRTNVQVCLAEVDSVIPELGRDSDLVICDYGYALTVHKSQGSEFPKVLVIEEIWAQKWDSRRWKYTAATRASKELGWVTS